MALEFINVRIEDSVVEENGDVRDDVGTSYVQTDEALGEETCEFTNTNPVSSQYSTSLSTEGQIEKNHGFDCKSS